MATKPTITRNDVITDIMNVAKKIKAVPSREEYRRFGGFASSTAEKKLGSWGIVSEKLKATEFAWR